MSTLATNNITDAAGGNTATINGMTPTADSLQGFRNRIINGGMVIDQRNAGASVTPTAGYTLDRWLVYEGTDGAISIQQVSDAPSGFSNSLKATTTTADSSLGATQYCYLEQRIEGYNFFDLGFGTASAQNVTLSFQVKSSLTGTFGGVLMNSANNRCYPFTYTINAANTWETKSVTVAGDTTGTWVGATNGIGIRAIFGLGIGSTYSGTAGAWAGAELYSTTGAVPLIGTLNATWQITGVQLEAGSVATPFERRDYGRELIMCMRYCYVVDSTNSPFMALGSASTSTTRMWCSLPLPVTTRVKPTGISYNGSVGNFFINGQNTNMTLTSLTFSSANLNMALLLCDGASGNTVGQFGTLYNNASGIRIEFTGMEL